MGWSALRSRGVVSRVDMPTPPPKRCICRLGMWYNSAPEHHCTCPGRTAADSRNQLGSTCLLHIACRSTPASRCRCLQGTTRNCSRLSCCTCRPGKYCTMPGQECPGTCHWGIRRRLPEYHLQRSTQVSMFCMVYFVSRNNGRSCNCTGWSPNCYFFRLDNVYTTIARILRCSSH